MEDRETYRLNDDDFYPTGYVIIDDTKESIGLKTNSDTRYLLINWRHDHALTDVSDKNPRILYTVLSLIRNTLCLIFPENMVITIIIIRCLS